MSAFEKSDLPTYLSVKQAASYLQLNDKKIYELANSGIIPGTKVTGKWMFPRELLDHWMLESSQTGLLSDQLMFAGADDPLLSLCVNSITNKKDNKALINYSPTSTRMGLDLLQARRIDICCIHWGPYKESHIRHPALLQHYSQHKNWVIIRAFKREHGLIVKPQLLEFAESLQSLFDKEYRWTRRQTGSGTQRFFQELLSQNEATLDDINCEIEATSSRESISTVVLNKADITLGSRSTAKEHCQGFISLGWEAIDFVMPRSIWFRNIFQDLAKQLQSTKIIEAAELLSGYDLGDTGELIWGGD